MSKPLTLKKIKKQFQSQWVLLGDPETGADLTVMGGTVLFHSKDRDEVYRQARKLRPKHSAILFTGQLPSETAVIL